ncbi:Peroxiredoxin [Arenibacter nanhaiticus]|uniref:Peroxiredoxin n=1 Tax=Arenibacter nanhaiticus TaxID=558155 RepID=A0A1M6GZW4_9FLAO|nr:TlpA disulfide reductase family protein [Arenibacter nanhaiticus]SHJ15491.1 Peroxiredoxin [Arenibacter nanhaiticus]
MNTKDKKSIIKYSALLALVLVLYTTGLHAQVIGFFQQGILMTGLMNPKLEITAEETNYTPADYNLSLINSKGEKLHLKDLKGKVIFMNLWATWCPPCIAEMPSINDLYNKMDKEDVQFIMLSLDNNFEKAKKFKENKGYDFEVYQVDGYLPKMYNTPSIPTTFVIDAKGKLALTHKGMADYSTQEFQDFLNGLK